MTTVQATGNPYMKGRVNGFVDVYPGHGINLCVADESSPPRTKAATVVLAPEEATHLAGEILLAVAEHKRMKEER